MTFGRSRHDSLSSSGFGPGPASGPQLDALHIDGNADGFGGRGRGADGFGGAPVRPLQLDLATDRADGDPSRAHAVAAAATAGPAESLPHLDVIQRAFGPHDVGGIHAHTDAAAATGASALGARAFATGNHVAFASSSPDLHTAAHEGAHVVQQRSGVALKDGLGAAGDAHERHADAVADAVVRGESAAALLGQPAADHATSHAIQRAPATSEQLTTSASTMLHVDGDARAVIAATTALMRAKGRADTIRAAATSGPPALATAQLTSLIEDMLPHVQVVAAAQQRHADVMASPAATMPMTREQVVGPERGLAHALSSNVPLVVDVLNNVARAALELGHAPDVDGAMGRLAASARALDWTPPRDPAEAITRRRAHEACPLDSNDEDPARCHLSDAQRVELRSDVKLELLKVGTKFSQACAPAAAAIQRLIARRAASEEFLASALIDTVVGVAKKLGPSEFLFGWALDFGKSVRKTWLAGGADPELSDRARALEALDRAVHQALAEMGERVLQLDDDTLQSLLLVLRELTEAMFKSRIDGFVARYANQVSPLGHIRGGDPWRPSLDEGGEQVAVWIKLDAGHKRLARVGHSTLQSAPIGRRGIVDMYHFVTWIDDDLHGAAGADRAPTVDATSIDGLPLNEIMRGDAR